MGEGPISSYNSHQSSISYISWKAKHHSILHPHSPKSSYICLQVLQAEEFHQSHLILRNQSFHPCSHISFSSNKYTKMMIKKNYVHTCISDEQDNACFYSILHISWKAKYHNIFHPRSPNFLCICLQMLLEHHQSHWSQRNQSFHSCPHISFS